MRVCRHVSFEKEKKKTTVRFVCLYSLVKFFLCVDLQGLIALLFLPNPSEVLLGTFLQNLLILSEEGKTIACAVLMGSAECVSDATWWWKRILSDMWGNAFTKIIRSSCFLSDLPRDNYDPGEGEHPTSNSRLTSPVKPNTHISSQSVTLRKPSRTSFIFS